MVKEDIILNNEAEESTFPELQISKFKKLAKEQFQLDVSVEKDPLKNIKDISRFYSFNIPSHLSEVFIRFEEAPIFWIMRSPLIEHLESVYKALSSQSAGQNIYKSIREFYTKWIIIKSGNEKKYFAASLLNAVEKKSNKSNFIFLMMQAIVLSYEKQIFNPERALELLEHSKEVLTEGKLNEEFKEDISYLINLYSGFVFLNQRDLLSAKDKFAEAVSIKPAGITAKFYGSLADVGLNQVPISNELLSDLYNYDISRIEYAIDTNDAVLLDYFLRFPVLSNIFYYKEFAPSYEIILDFLNTAMHSSAIDIKTIANKVNTFKSLEINEFYNEKVINDLVFFDKLIQNFSDNGNVLFMGAMSKLQQKFNTTAEEITKAIRNKHQVKLREKLLIYDKELHDILNEIQTQTRNNEEYKAKAKEKLEHNIKVIEDRAVENVAILEERIKNLQFIQSLNPRSTFRNAMVYNFILSVTVFLMGGCAGYSNSFMDEIGRSGSMFTVVVVTGLKWGLIAFIVGLVISVIASGLALLESSNQKQKLQQMIKAIKEEKEYHVEYYKKDYERNVKDSDEKYNRSVEDKKKRMENIKAERDNQEKIYAEEAEQKIREESKQLMALIQI